MTEKQMMAIRVAIQCCEDAYVKGRSHASHAAAEVLRDMLAAQPVAWVVEWIGDSSIDGIDVRQVFYDRESAERSIENAKSKCRVIPLYRSPQK